MVNVQIYEEKGKKDEEQRDCGKVCSSLASAVTIPVIQRAYMPCSGQAIDPEAGRPRWLRPVFAEMQMAVGGECEVQQANRRKKLWGVLKGLLQY